MCYYDDREEWEKEGYSSEEDYRQAMYDTSVSIAIYEERKKQAEKEGRELTWEEKMDLINFV